MKLYNSYSLQLEELKPIEPGKVSMYVCGPTVYNYPHIGNARPIAVFDTLKKALSAQGLDVTFVSNYTDVDDKIINAAIENNVSEKEITDKYIEAYNEVRNNLNADLPDVAPRVTETMDQIIEFIDKMVKNGSAYVVDGDVYFRVSSDPKYGELSHQKMEDLMVGARIDENTKKENPLDFTLWKVTEKGIKWDSPWSKGRPGWHTECVVMIQNVFKISKKNFALCPYDRFNCEAPAIVGDINMFPSVITNERADAAYKEYYFQHKIQVFATFNI